MSAENVTTAFTLKCETSDPYDASIRLLNDAQRIGAELVSLQVTGNDKALSLTIRVPAWIDQRNLADRMARHGAVLPLQVEEAE